MKRMCESCHTRKATKEYHDGIDLWHLCGYCLRSFRAIDRQFDAAISKVDPDIPADAWAEDQEDQD